MKRLAALLVLAVGCVADVPGDGTAMPNPAPAGDGERTGSAGDPSTQNSVTATAYLEQIALIQCAEAFSCRATYPGDAASFESAWKGSVEACVSYLLVAWNVNGLETEIAKGRINFDGTAALNCLAGVAFGSCDQHWNTGIQWAESCYSVLVGNVATGGSCESVYACQSYNCDTVEHRCI